MKMKFSKNKNKYFYPLKDNSLRNSDLMEGIKVILSKNVTMMKRTLNFENLFRKKFRLSNLFFI